jgi:hypothetical protein
MEIPNNPEMGWLVLECPIESGGDGLAGSC